MTTTVDTGQGFRYGLGIFTRRTPCGTVWGHDGGVFGYISFAFTDRRGSRTAVILLPTFADEAIMAAGEPVLDIAVCMMLGQPVQATPAVRSPAMSLPTIG
jgi:D-alanyl-D-alanine carboxypeptidase